MAPASNEGGREDQLMKLSRRKQQNMLLLLLLLSQPVLLSMQPVLLLNKLLLLMDWVLRVPLHKLPPPDKLLLTQDRMWIPPLQHLLLPAPAQGVVVPAAAMLDRQVQGAQLLHPRWPTQARRESGPPPSTSPSEPPLRRRPVKWRMLP